MFDVADENVWLSESEWLDGFQEPQVQISLRSNISMFSKKYFSVLNVE